MPSLSMTRPRSSRWNSRKVPSSSAPLPPEAASRPVAVRVKVSAVRVERARQPRMPPPLLSRRATAAACGEGAARATAAEGDIERRNEASVVARVVASARARCSALGRSRSVVWPLPGARVGESSWSGKVLLPPAR